VQLVGAVLAVDVVVTPGAEERVRAALAEERIVARRPAQDVADLGAGDDEAASESLAPSAGTGVTVSQLSSTSRVGATSST
jgi:hypothetical protein